MSDRLEELLLLVAAGQKAILYNLIDMRELAPKESTIQAHKKWAELYRKTIGNPREHCDYCSQPLVHEEGWVFMLPYKGALNKVGPLCRACARGMQSEKCTNCLSPLTPEDGWVILQEIDKVDVGPLCRECARKTGA